MARPKGNSLQRLQAKKRRAEQDLATLNARLVRAVRAEVEALISSRGLTIADLFPALASARSKAAAEPAAKSVGRRQRRRAVSKPKKAVPVGGRAVRGTLYADPANPKSTWRGFGKRPRWFNDAINAGKTEADLRAPSKSKKG